MVLAGTPAGPDRCGRLNGNQLRVQLIPGRRSSHTAPWALRLSEQPPAVGAPSGTEGRQVPQLWVAGIAFSEPSSAHVRPY